MLPKCLAPCYDDNNHMSFKAKLLRDFIIIIIIFVLAFWLGKFVLNNEAARAFISQFGYFGAFVVAVIAGFNLVVPLPAISFLPVFLAAGLHFFPLIIVMTAGETLSDVASYYIGRVGRHMADEVLRQRIVNQLRRFKNRFAWLPLATLFVFACFAPLPNELLVIPLGFLNYRIRSIGIVVLLGNFIFNMLYAFGIIKIFNLV